MRPAIRAAHELTLSFVRTKDGEIDVAWRITENLSARQDNGGNFPRTAMGSERSARSARLRGSVARHPYRSGSKAHLPTRWPILQRHGRAWRHRCCPASHFDAVGSPRRE